MLKITDLLEKSPLWQQLQARYELLSEKDRRALHLLTAFLTAAFFYLMVWEPLSTWSSEQKEEFLRQQTAYEWMEENIDDARATQKKQKTGGQKDLSSVVSGTSRQAGITISRVQPDRKGLGVWVEDAAYQKLLGWMVALDTRYEITIQQVKIDKGKEEGRVKAYLHLAN